LHLYWLGWPSHIIARCLPFALHRRMNDATARRVRSDPEAYYRSLRLRLSREERAAFARGVVAPTLVEAFAEGFRQGGAGHTWNAGLGVRPWGFSPRDLAVETFVWHGGKDTLSSPAMARVLARTIPNCHATYYPGEGHLVFDRHAAQIVATLAGTRASVSASVAATASAASDGD
jgi:pimeloyl-ACP methyl ester carboxylesterase